MACCKTLLSIVLPVIVAYCFFTRVKFDPESVRGKRVLVTGASSGIGESVAYKYAILKARLVITARRKDLLENVARRCKELGAEEVHFVVADMAIPAERRKVVEATRKHLGGLDFLILNHAAMRYAYWKGNAEDLVISEIMMNVNFYSHVHLTSMLLEDLKQSNGHIGVVSSVAGKLGSPGLAPYCANKHALQGFYSSLRQELRAKNTNLSITFIVYGPIASDKGIEIANKIDMPLDFTYFAGSTEDAADVLVRGVSARAYEVYFPTLGGTLVVYLNRIIPMIMEDTSVNFMSRKQ